MPSKLRFALVLLSILPILSLLNVAMAAKKPPEAETIALKAGPVIGGIFTCDVSNYTDQPIPIVIEWCSGPRDNPGVATTCGTADLTLQPSANYADPLKISDEIEWCQSYYENYRKWTIIDISNKAVEEAATSILNAFQKKE